MNAKKIEIAELQDLREARDEARLQTHLFTAEMHAQPKRLEEDWKKLKRNLKQQQPQFLEGVKQITEPLVSDLRAAYKTLVGQTQPRSK